MNSAEMRRIGYSSMMIRMLSAGTLLLLLALALGVGQAFSRAPARGSSFSDFPLEKDVIGKTFAKLDEGILPNGTRWAAYGSRLGTGKHWRDHPCVSIARITKYGLYGATHACGPLAPAHEGEPPVFTSIEDHRVAEGKEVAGETIFAMSLQSSITSIQITTSGGEKVRYKARLLKGSRQKKAHLAKFRYVAVGLERAICIAGVTGYKADGEVVFETPTERCETGDQLHS